MPSPQVYRGLVRKLVVGIDVGTTFSGVSYAVLDPGEVLSIRTINRYPGQENDSGNSKIPSVLYYRQDGTLHSVGAEAKAPGMELVAEDENLIFVEWFKLHLRPESLDAGAISRKDLAPLPPKKTVIEVFADFLNYLFDCARRYISETHGNGESLWNSVKDRIEFVLSHPNGWEGLQQGKMRQAAVLAGLVPDTTVGHSRIHFVTEGEASLNYCINNGLATHAMQDGKGVIIVDAGGGTVDISSYLFLSTSPVSVEEVTSPECILQGSTRVNVRLHEHLKKHLASSAFANEEDIKSMLEHFDQNAKPVFKDEKEPSYIKFGGMKDNDPKVNIRRGQLTLSGSDMASFFKPALQSIFNAIQSQRDGASSTLLTAFLVGGFAASPWLYSSLKKKLEARGVALYRPDSHTNKAVADGAVSFYLDHFVSSRVTKVTYGTEVCVKYDPDDPEHFARRYQKFVRPSGTFRLPNGFSVVLQKGTRIREKEEISEWFLQEARESRTLSTISCDVICYRGRGTPTWVDVDPEMFAPLCTIYADTSRVSRQSKQGINGVYYTQEFKIVLLCGLTEMQAQLSWMENGVEKRGPARIVYDDDLQISR
ncbi:hypothetical protein GSI_03393 [Ganoderma sinense ZZ0214-1]|uniref:Uncharacterized protein n=1 Tax=Ganoderma sinense ZZ0214-1 TaxID=1077348 RepID=A0A2G8SLH8_9APHY|nr:hypothetical protein GSI_03393 [Ganoderma sinense ZZ0214-1]